MGSHPPLLRLHTSVCYIYTTWLKWHAFLFKKKSASFASWKKNHCFETHMLHLLQLLLWAWWEMSTTPWKLPHPVAGPTETLCWKCVSIKSLSHICKLLIGRCKMFIFIFILSSEWLTGHGRRMFDPSPDCAPARWYKQSVNDWWLIASALFITALSWTILLL